VKMYPEDRVWVVALTFLVAVLIVACVMLPPPLPVPPTPVPTPTPEPSGLTRADFAPIVIGDDGAEALKSLPMPDRTVKVDDSLTLLAWRLDEPRIEGGRVWWEVHLDAQGVVTASFAW